MAQLNRNGGDPRSQLFTTDDLSAQKEYVCEKYSCHARTYTCHSRAERQLMDVNRRYQEKGEEAKVASQRKANSDQRLRALDVSRVSPFIKQLPNNTGLRFNVEKSKRKLANCGQSAINFKRT